MTINTEPYQGVIDALTSVRIAEISQTHLIPNQQEEIIITGDNLTDKTWVDIQDCTTLETELIEQRQLRVKLTSGKKKGNKKLTTTRQREESEVFSDAVSIADFSNIPQADNAGWIELNDTKSFVIGSEPGAEIRKYKNNQVIQNEEGMYLNRTGYLLFDFLEFDKNSLKSIDFIFKFNGREYFSFGIANEDFNYNRSSFYQAVACFRFNRNKIRYSYGNNLKNDFGEFQIHKDKYYRFRINKSGNPKQLVELFLLNSPNKADWGQGVPFWQAEIPLNLTNNGEKVIPALLESNENTNPLLAIRVF